MPQPRVKRITIDVSPEFHARLKIGAAAEHMSIKDFVIHHLDERLPKKIPNALTRKVFEESERGENLVRFKSTEHLFEGTSE